MSSTPKAARMHHGATRLLRSAALAASALVVLAVALMPHTVAARELLGSGAAGSASPKPGPAPLTAVRRVTRGACGLHCSKTYAAQKGDTCAAVYKAFGLSKAEFEDLNFEYFYPLPMPFNCAKPLPTGQLMCVKRAPTGSPASEDDNSTVPLPAGCNTKYKLGPESDPHACSWIAIVRPGMVCKEMLAKYQALYPAGRFAELNPGVSCNTIKIGQLLCMGYPEGDTPTPAPPIDTKKARGACGLHCSKTYAAQKGDTCAAVYGAFGLSKAEFEDLNFEYFYPLPMPFNCAKPLPAGQLMCVERAPDGSPASEDADSTVPLPAGCDTKYKLGPESDAHACSWIAIVRPGVVCEELIKEYEVMYPAGRFKELNPGFSCDTVRIGQLICMGYGAQ